MSAHEYTIQVNDLDAGGKELHFVVRAAWVRGALEGHEATSAGSDGTLAVRASKSASDVVVHGTLDAELTVPCARCLEPTHLSVHANLSVMYVPAAKLSADEAEGELSDEEANTLPYEGETVVLDGLVRDELVLEIPMIPLCSEDCPGMAPPASDQGTEAAKPIDPRLAPLLAFKAKTKKDP